MALYEYLLRCADGSYYVGQTDDPDQRLADHDASPGRLEKYDAVRYHGAGTEPDFALSWTVTSQG